MVVSSAGYTPRVVSGASTSSSESNAISATSSSDTNITVPSCTEEESKEEPGCARQVGIETETPQSIAEDASGTFTFLRCPAPAITRELLRLPICHHPRRMALWAAHIAVLRWLEAEGEAFEASEGGIDAPTELKVGPDVFAWAVFKCVLDMYVFPRLSIQVSLMTPPLIEPGIQPCNEARGRAKSAPLSLVRGGNGSI